MDLQNFIPQETSRGDPIFVESEKQFATIYYKRRRGRPKPVKIRRSISEDLFLVGVTIWACEGTRTRPYELEIAQLIRVSSQTLPRVAPTNWNISIRDSQNTCPDRRLREIPTTLEENVGNR